MGKKAVIMIIFYNILQFAAMVVFSPLIAYCLITSPKRQKTFLKRLGFFTFRGVPNKLFDHEKPIWIHALSLGEVLSIVTMVKQIREKFPDRKILFSVSTLTGFEIADKNLDGLVDRIVFFPYDLFFSVKRWIRKIDPEFVIIVETDIWPNFLFGMTNEQIPIYLVNARLSDRSFHGYKKVLFFLKPFLSCFSKICTQTAMDQERFHLLGIDKAKVVVTGNTKFDQAVACPSTGEIDALKSSLPIGSHQKVFIAGSTHPGEEKIILEAFMQMKKDIPDLILIIAPRHPERSQSVYAMFHAREFASLMITKLNTLHADETCDVIVVDTIGLLKKLYGLCSVAFIGGTFSDTGGHNPLEPATFAKPILFGPNMKNFADISNMLIRNNGARYVSDARDLYRETVRLLKDTAQSREMGTNAFQLLDRQTGAVDRTLKIISQHIRHLPKTTAPSYLVPEPLPLIAKE